MHAAKERKSGLIVASWVNAYISTLSKFEVAGWRSRQGGTRWRNQFVCKSGLGLLSVQPRLLLQIFAPLLTEQSRVKQL